MADKPPSGKEHLHSQHFASMADVRCVCEVHPEPERSALCPVSSRCFGSMIDSTHDTATVIQRLQFLVCVAAQKETICTADSLNTYS